MSTHSGTQVTDALREEFAILIISRRYWSFLIDADFVLCELQGRKTADDSNITVEHDSLFITQFKISRLVRGIDYVRLQMFCEDTEKIDNAWCITWENTLKLLLNILLSFIHELKYGDDNRASVPEVLRFADLSYLVI